MCWCCWMVLGLKDYWQPSLPAMLPWDALSNSFVWPVGWLKRTYWTSDRLVPWTMSTGLQHLHCLSGVNQPPSPPFRTSLPHPFWTHRTLPNDLCSIVTKWDPNCVPYSDSFNVPYPPHKPCCQCDQLNLRTHTIHFDPPHQQQPLNSHHLLTLCFPSAFVVT